MSLHIVVPGEPIPKGRPRLNRKTGTFYTPPETRAYEDAIAMMALTSKERFGDDLVRFIAVFHCARKRRLDTDNLIKSSLDGLAKSHVINNDTQVVEIHALRVDDAETPRTEITVERLEAYE